MSSALPSASTARLGSACGLSLVRTIATSAAVNLTRWPEVGVTAPGPDQCGGEDGVVACLDRLGLDRQVGGQVRNQRIGLRLIEARDQPGDRRVQRHLG